MIATSPSGSRDVKRSADFSDGTLQTFAVDTGVWTVSSGVLTVAAQSQGQDAAAVWYHDQYLPVYYELFGRISIVKPTAGWKGNAYAIFDYFGPDDFKFAGLDDASRHVLRALLTGATQARAAAELGVSGSAVSQRVARAHLAVLADAIARLQEVA